MASLRVINGCNSRKWYKSIVIVLSSFVQEALRGPIKIADSEAVVIGKKNSINYYNVTLNITLNLNGKIHVTLVLEFRKVPHHQSQLVN